MRPQHLVSTGKNRYFTQVSWPLMTTYPLCFEDFEELKFTVPPLRKSDDYGIDVYCQALEFVSLKISV